MTLPPLSPASDAFMAQLAQTLPPEAFRPESDAYLVEPRRKWQGQGRVVAPHSVAQVAAVVRACAAAKVGIVPYAGGTGLVGGQVCPDGPVPLVLSVERLNEIKAVYANENVIVAGAGVILADLQEAAQSAGRLFPLSLASDGSARIGGLLGTNAGGINVLRWGNMRALCLGVEVVLPDGQIWQGMRRLRKDNTGYDLRDLFIGSEGTLGVITAATLRMVAEPAQICTAFFAVRSPAAALELLALAQDMVGDGVSAFELIHRQGFDFITEAGLPGQMPFSPLPAWAVLIELGLGRGSDPAETLAELFETGMRQGLCDDGVIASSQAQRAAFWNLRETIPEGNRRIGAIASHDISLPLSHIAEFIDKAPELIAPLGPLRINCFGHLGDGNLHYNMFPPQGESRENYAGIAPQLSDIVHQLAHDLGGSISAEHGIGRLKRDDLARFSDPAKMAMMRAVKQALDPDWIMNPGAVFARD
ncbi:MAG: FAD-binding oxidoreductase [Rhodobacteraceae bacterium]|nr:FAD-binding oxidoreductase [Paracoccaceae bacterium]